MMAATLAAGSSTGKDREALLHTGFLNPSDEFRPRTWWHWISNNVSKPGITKDLEAMKRIGLKGAQITTMPQGGPFGDTKYLSPEWFDAVEHAEKEAARLGLILGFSNAIGCSGAGGPWITPELSMQKLVWSERVQRGPFEGDIQLPQPEEIDGYYRDVKVLAFPTVPGDEIPLDTLNPKISSDIPGFRPDAVIDGNTDTGETVAGTGGIVSIQFEFKEPQVARSLQVYLASPDASRMEYARVNLLTSADGLTWSKLVSTGARESFNISAVKVLSDGFPEAKSRFYKVELQTAKNQKLSLREISFGAARLPRNNFKAARSSNHPTVFEPLPLDIPRQQVVDSKQIRDLSGQMSSTGKVHLQLPEGNWTIIRFGHTSTGKKMVPDTPADKDRTGLEADKMSRKAILTHLNQGLPGQVLEHYKKWNDKVRITINIDSWECGPQTWTPEFPGEFQKRRGYDCLSRLLTVTGRIVDSVDETERYLWDYRRTIADLYAENFYGTFSEFCHSHDMLLDGEAPGIGIPAIADGLQCLGIMDVPQGEFWIEAKPGPDRPLGLGGSDNTKEAAVASHIYGKGVTSCESFTSFGYADGWQMDPLQLKPIGDRQFCLGMNEMVFHRYVHQPDDRVPGMTLGQFGLNFDRTLTWWEQGRDWIEYITRCQYMLRQGLFVADVCYFYGENAPSSVWYFVPKILDPRKRMTPTLPAGYDYDCCDWTSLNKMTVKDGRVVLPDGMSYAYLVIPGNAQLTVHALRKVQELVKAGATVVGSKPFRSPSLTNYPASDRQIQDMAKELWPQVPAPAERKVGKGRVIDNQSFESIFQNDKLPQDFEAVSTQSGADLRYIHRKQGDVDFYFVSNQRDRQEEATLYFRVYGKVPEIWHPETGTTEPAPVYEVVDGRTAVAVRLSPSESCFIVFRKEAKGADSIIDLRKDGQMTGLSIAKLAAVAREAPVTSLLPEASLSVNGAIRVRAWEAGQYTAELKSGAKREVTITSVPGPVTINGPWNVTFQAGRLAPEGLVVFDKLISWTDHLAPAIKYFSGTATYAKSIDIPEARLGAGKSVYLDLGDVKNVAEVFVNGKSLGVLWKMPFRADITPAIHAGMNQIEIKVTNLWPNRLIGDQKLPEKERVTWAFYKFYTAESPLLESGLLGPVRLLSSIESELHD